MLALLLGAQGLLHTADSPALQVTALTDLSCDAVEVERETADLNREHALIATGAAAVQRRALDVGYEELAQIYSEVHDAPEATERRCRFALRNADS